MTKAVSLNPKLDDASVHDCRAKCFVNLAKLDQALAEANTAVKLAPTSDRFRLRGQLYFQRKQYPKAMESFGDAIKASPKDYWNYYDRASCYAFLNMNKEAIADYTQVIARAPTEPSAYVFRAKLYDKLGLHDLARKDREQASKRTDFSM